MLYIVYYIQLFVVYKQRCLNMEKGLILSVFWDDFGPKFVFTSPVNSFSIQLHISQIYYASRQLIVFWILSLFQCKHTGHEYVCNWATGWCKTNYHSQTEGVSKVIPLVEAFNSRHTRTAVHWRKTFIKYTDMERLAIPHVAHVWNATQPYCLISHEIWMIMSAAMLMVQATC